jgi:DNA-binding Xre family transcriptional regulator
MFEAKTKLDQILHDKGWSTKDLERALHERGLKIEYYALTEYRSGKRKNMTIETLNKLCVALDVTPNDLVEVDAAPLPHKQRKPQSEVVQQSQDSVDENGDDEVRKYEEHVDWYDKREADIRHEYQEVEAELEHDAEESGAEEEEDFGF